MNYKYISSHKHLLLFQCVYQALNITVQLTRRQLEATQGSNRLVQLLVAVHLSFAQIQGRLSHFARLVNMYPALLGQANAAQLARQEGQMVMNIFLLIPISTQGLNKVIAHEIFFFFFFKVQI